MKRPPSDGDTPDRRSVHISRCIFNRCITREGAFYPAVLKQWSSHVSFNLWNRCDFFNTACSGKAVQNGKVVFSDPLSLFLGQGFIVQVLVQHTVPSYTPFHLNFFSYISSTLRLYNLRPSFDCFAHKIGRAHV